MQLDNLDIWSIIIENKITLSYYRQFHEFVLKPEDHDEILDYLAIEVSKNLIKIKNISYSFCLRHDIEYQV